MSGLPPADAVPDPEEEKLNGGENGFLHGTIGFQATGVHGDRRK